MNELRRISEKIFQNERLTRDDGLILLQCNDLTYLSMLANHVRNRLHPDRCVTYIVDRNINYTNICSAGCYFCAFHCKPGSEKGFVLDKKILAQKIEETKTLGGVQILLQGGLNPGLKIDWFEDLFRWIKEKHPIHIHGLSPPEILYIAKTSKLSVEETLLRLMDAGLDSIPGGGAEILVEDVRRKMNAHIKATAEEWLDLMRTAHSLGLLTTATMMFGAVETPADRLDHLLKIREVQEQATVDSRQPSVDSRQLTVDSSQSGFRKNRIHAGFTAFIPWVYQPDRTRLGGIKVSSFEYLKMVAISRLMLDNIPSIQASWVTQGERISQIALRFGCNDLGSTMIEENVVAATGVKFSMTIEQMESIIRQSGYVPVQRNQAYEYLSYSGNECKNYM
ncbi:MAG TPA: dehypoxanthine futalosine cyclase [Candidatus Marinimicrobia bacterium]|nr:dehypoxanthine futalosine cyclase [Candidatus Neomarinimicrobiota bacterium]